ncbi:MAG: AI-2E family transporter [Actinobacteria bacterium]|nr:AI-2E family transporter [Actinomycetota bacterium]
MSFRVLHRGRSVTGDGVDSRADLAPPAARADPDPPPPPGALTNPPTNPVGASPVAPAVVPRWVQAVVLPLALLGLWALARAAGPVLLILVAAAVIALILNPLVQMIEHRHLPRGLAILTVYLGGLAFLVGIGILLSSPISTQVGRFQKDIPHLVNQADHDLHNLQNFLDRSGIKVHVQKQGQTALQTLQKTLLKRSGDIVSFSQGLLTQIISFSFDLLLVLVLSIYLLVYGRDIGALVRGIMPTGDGTADDFPVLVQQAVFGYVRGQVLFSLIMGASAALSLWVFGLLGIFPQGSSYAVFFGAFYGLMEFIPYIGPIIGPAPAVIVALFNDPISAVWLVLLFVTLQQLEGHVIAPQVFRLSLRINPILIILGLLIGYRLYGIVGALLALPVAAVIRQTVIYLRRHVTLEPWETVAPRPPPATGQEDPEREPSAGTHS